MIEICSYFTYCKREMKNNRNGFGLRYTHISHIVKDNNRPELIKERIKMESIEVF